MGETEEKENGPAEGQEVDDAKETDKMLRKTTGADALTKKDDVIAEIKKDAKDKIKEFKDKAKEEKDEIKKAISAVVAASVQSNTATINGNGGDEIVNIPDTMPTSGSPVTAEGREVKPKKIPIGGIKMPGFFTRTKTPAKMDGDGAEELLPETTPTNPAVEPIGTLSVADESIVDDKKPETRSRTAAFLSSLHIRNPFRRSANKPADEQELKESKEDQKSPEAALILSDAAKQLPDLDCPEKAVDDEDTMPATKKGSLLGSLRLPPLANMIPKRLRRGASDDIEQGHGPNNRAGLASMETLDDSMKDVDLKETTDNNGVKGSNGAVDTIDSVKLDSTAAGGEKVDLDTEKKRSCWASIKGYRCSVDDLAIIGGIVLFILMLIIILAVSLGGKADNTEAPLRDGRYIEAVTSCGPVEGLLEDGAYAFRGIPYAVAPIDENRWRPAQLFSSIDDCWNGTFRAHNATVECWQQYDDASQEGDEDCLTLDVITPHVRYENPVPVVVLIGAETMVGDSPGKMRPSATFAHSREIIYVRPKFRLGVMGFTVSQELAVSTRPPTSGNYGLSDLIAALEWIQLNIAHFGGDPKMVTLFGHRAGGTLVTALITSSKASSLFARAWISSASAIYPGKPLAESGRDDSEFLNVFNCEDASCLRRVSPSELMTSIPEGWLPDMIDLPLKNENSSASHQWLVLDSQILTKHPLDVLAKDEEEKKTEMKRPRLVIGSTAHESHSIKLQKRFVEWTPELVREYIDNSYIGQIGQTDEVLKMYNATYAGLVSMITDIRTICPLLTMARVLPSVPFYVVTQTNGTGELALADADADVQAILGRYETKTSQQRRYVSAIQQMFYHFVAHGEVPQHDRQRRIYNIGQDANKIDNLPNCDFWIKHDMVPRFGRVN